ncbi:hypothetical protein NDU88_010194 [Pleurodeles waltl]|uniref:Uncharacterized protein n=1 Tax=Pleurodeles waltl TaxID=8319 RepID=A0AAV7S2K2_PLEWA|nr:hypothetical protein NDU88_010194 [Pleurodeles waltl]
MSPQPGLPPQTLSKPAGTPAEEEELAPTQRGKKDQTETPDKESNAELVRTPRREEPPEDSSSRSSASHVPGGTWLSQVEDQEAQWVVPSKKDKEITKGFVACFRISLVIAGAVQSSCWKTMKDLHK